MNFNIPIESKVACSVILKNDKGEKLKITGEYYTVVRCCGVTGRDHSRGGRYVSRDLLRLKIDLFGFDNIKFDFDSIKTIYDNLPEGVTDEYCTKYFNSYQYRYLSFFVYEGNDYTEYRQLFLDRLIRDPEYYYIIHEKCGFNLDNINLKDINIHPEVDKVRLTFDIIASWLHLYAYVYNYQDKELIYKVVAHKFGRGNYHSIEDLYTIIRDIGDRDGRGGPSISRLECDMKPLY